MMKWFLIAIFCFITILSPATAVPAAGLMFGMPAAIETQNINVYRRSLPNVRGAVAEKITDADYFATISFNERIRPVSSKPLNQVQGIDHQYLVFDKKTAIPRQIFIGETKFTNGDPIKQLNKNNSPISELSDEWIASRLQYSFNSYDEIKSSILRDEIIFKRPLSEMEIETFPISSSGYFYKENGRYYYYDSRVWSNSELAERLDSILDLYRRTISGDVAPRIRLIQYTVEDGQIIQRVYARNIESKSQRLSNDDFKLEEAIALSPKAVNKFINSPGVKEKILESYEIVDDSVYSKFTRQDKVNLIAGEMNNDIFVKIMSSPDNRISFNSKFNFNSNYLPEFSNAELKKIYARHNINVEEIIANQRVKQTDYLLDRFFSSSPFRYSTNFVFAAAFSSVYDLISSGSFNVQNTLYAGGLAVVSEAAETGLLKLMKATPATQLNFTGFSKFVVAEAVIDIAIDSAFTLNSYFNGEIDSGQLSRRLLIQTGTNIFAAAAVEGLRFAGGRMILTGNPYLVAAGVVIKYGAPFLYIPLNKTLDSVIQYFDEKAILNQLIDSSFLVIEDWIKQEEKLDFSLSID